MADYATTDICRWCGDCYGDHDAKRGVNKPVPRMPCGGLKSKFLLRADQQAKADKRNPFERAAELAHSVEVHKFSALTYPPDVKDPEMPEDMRAAIERQTVGKVWRARLGRSRRWWYGWSATEALEKALGDK